MNLVGKQNVKFTNQETGEVIEGVKLHFTGYDPNVRGEAAMTQFIRCDHPCYSKAIAIDLGEFNIIYGRKGIVQDILGK